MPLILAKKTGGFEYLQTTLSFVMDVSALVSSLLKDFGDFLVWRKDGVPTNAL